MKRALRSRLLAAAALLVLPAALFASETLPPLMTVDEVRPGMRGYALTVFEGVTPEPMEVEVLGVMRNVNGPRGDVILVRLHGEKIEFSGVVAGMSGSPVYIEGKLLGAIAFRIGQFSRLPIAGVTPITEMLQIGAGDATAAQSRAAAPPSPAGEMGRISAPTPAAGHGEGYTSHLTPIETPLVFSGFSEEAVQRFAPEFSAAGIVPVMGAGSASAEPQPEPLEPGSAVSAVLVRGDMNIAATCTVTYVDPERLLACGHPILQFGRVDLPMAKAHVLATLPSPLNAFKIVNTTESVGAFVQDRHTGILGVFGRQPQMIPVRLTVHGGAQPRSFQYELLNHPRLTAVAMMTTVFNALRGQNEYGEEITFRLRGRIAVEGYPDVTLQNMFAPMDNNLPTAFAVAISVGERLSRIFDNPHVTPNVEGVELEFDLVRERRSARLESARTDVTEARPGDDIVVETVLRPYRGERIVRQIPIKVPTSTPRGVLRILISDGDTLDRMRRLGNINSQRLDLASTIALLNKRNANHRLYVSLLEANPQAMVDDKIMPALPLSVMNVMDGMRGTREMVVVGESAVSEASTPLDYVVTGAQVITVTIK
jgi:hypothetical protein